MHRFHHWRVQIKDARNEQAIAQVIRDYRLTLPPELLESLPAECRVAIAAADIPGAALCLLHAEMKYPGDDPAIAAALHEIAHTYAAAAVKLTDWRGLR